MREKQSMGTATKGTFHAGWHDTELFELKREHNVLLFHPFVVAGRNRTVPAAVGFIECSMCIRNGSYNYWNDRLKSDITGSKGGPLCNDNDSIFAIGPVQYWEEYA